MKIIPELFEQTEKIKNFYENGQITEEESILKMTAATEIALQKLINKYEAHAFQINERLKKLKRKHPLPAQDEDRRL